MQDTAIGISIGIGLKGVSNLTKLKSGFKSLKGDIANAVSALVKFDSVKLNNLQEQIRLSRASLLDEARSNFSALTNSALIGVPIKLAIDDEAAFANVKKYVDDSEENLLILKNEMRKVSNELGESFANIANIASGGGKINLVGKELVEYTKLLATGSVAFEMSSEELSRASNNMKVGFKIDDINKMTELFDAINLLDNKVTNANASDIFTASSLTAANANLIGLNEKAASAIAATMLSTGKASSVVGTSLNALYSGLAMADKKGAKFQEALSAIGLDAGYLKTALQKDAAGAITLFIDRISQAPKQMQAGILYDLVGANFSDEIAGLVTNIDALKANMAMAFSDEASGSMQRELQVKLDTTKSGLERLTQSWRNLGGALGETFLPLVNGVASLLGGVANILSDLNAKFPTTSAVVVSVVAGFMMFKPLLLLTKLALLSVADGVIGVVKVLSLLNPITLIAKARTLAHTLVLKAQAFSMWLVGARLKASIALTALWTKLTKTNMVALSASTIGAKAYAGALWLINTASKAVALGARVMKFALISTGVGALVVAIGMAAAHLIENWDEVSAFFSNFWENIKPYWERAANFFNGIFDSVVEWWNSLFGGFFDWIGEKFGWIGKMVEATLGGLSSAWSSAKGLFGFGGEKEKIDSGKKESKGWFSGWFGSDDTKVSKPDTSYSTTHTTQPVATAMTANAATINVNFSGDFNIATSSGRFDLAEFERQLVTSVKRALRSDEMNARNRSVIGQ